MELLMNVKYRKNETQKEVFKKNLKELLEKANISLGEYYVSNVDILPPPKGGGFWL